MQFLASLSQDLDFPSQFGKVSFLSQMLSMLAIPLYQYGHSLPSGYENHGVYFVADSDASRREYASSFEEEVEE